MKVKRWLRVELKNGDVRKLDMADMRRVFNEFMLPVPDTDKVVVSMNFREKVLQYGLTFIVKDWENYGEVMFVPPSQIKNIRFFIDTRPIEDQPPE